MSQPSDNIENRIPERLKARQVGGECTNPGQRAYTNSVLVEFFFKSERYN